LVRLWAVRFRPGYALIILYKPGTVRVYGTIVWEIKNTRHWQPAWIDRLKADQRAIGADLAVLVSTAIPDSLVERYRSGSFEYLSADFSNWFDGAFDFDEGEPSSLRPPDNSGLRRMERKPSGKAAWRRVTG
jgi:Uncharacterized protein conserved in bacteria (DUF2130)